jgi:hypothetical protein
MRIDSYRFGNIVIDGVNYSSDVIILGGIVQANWWRKRGHLLSAEDLQPVITVKPKSSAVYFLWHFPAGYPGWLLATTVPCPARTFLQPA